MKIAKPMLLVTTPIGLIGSIYWAYRLAGGLVFLLVALLLVIAAAFVQLVGTARREAREQEARVVAAKVAAANAALYHSDSLKR
ncbi:MAG: hypothetical protein QM808_02705 [Steroidobacteraceae bacterium]